MRAAACFQLALVSQVNKRIRASLRIHLRTSSFNEPHPLIEANGLGVLHVDVCAQLPVQRQSMLQQPAADADRKSTRLNSSHTVISYAVFCLKKKNEDADGTH